MHLSDALISAPVGIGAAVVSAAAIGIAVRKVRKESTENMVPLMGVMGAFIFAAQMLNFTIPGTGSSGHIVGGVLLSALLGPWAALVTLASVIIIQCLIFADGGLMALGCNIFNMGVLSCLVAYPLIYRPLTRGASGMKPWRITLASLASCIVGLELGALCVVGETELSGVTALPADKFMMFMLPIHLLIGIGEGLATAAVLCFVARTRPDMLQRDYKAVSGKKRSLKRPVIIFAICAAIAGGLLAGFASSNPDGLEWSIEKTGASSKLPEVAAPATAVMPDYNNTFAGLIGAAMVLTVVWSVTSIATHRRHAAVRVKSDE